MKSIITNKLFYLLLLSMAGLTLACSKKDNDIETQPEQKKTEEEFQLAWADDFADQNLDLTNWYHRYPGVRDDGFNDNTAVSLSNGNLLIKVYSDTLNGVVKHHTGMIATKKEFLYGKFEMRAAFVNQSGSWSAFWLQSSTLGNPLGNPKQAGMEIDVVETLPKDGRVYHNVHWDGYGADHKTAGIKTADLGANSGNYHIYTLEWSPTAYKMYVDGQLTWTYTANISQRSEFIILSSEVKNWAAGSWAGPIPVGGYGSREATQTIMKVDYVKYYTVKN